MLCKRITLFPFMFLAENPYVDNSFKMSSNTTIELLVCVATHIMAPGKIGHFMPTYLLKRNGAI